MMPSSEKRTVACHTVAAILFFSCYGAFTFFAVVAGDERRNNPLPLQGSARDNVAAFVDWFPNDIESLVVARGPFVVPRKLPLEGVGENSSFEKLFEAVALSPLVSIRSAKYLPLLAGEVVLASVEGSKNIRAPGMGERPVWSGCHVLIFERGLGSAGTTLWKSLMDDATNTLAIAGHDVVSLQTPEDEPFPNTLFVSRPRHDVILCATEETFLKDMLTRITQKVKPKTMPESLLEWKQIDPNSRYWAIRHFDKKNAANDSSSPLHLDTNTGMPLDDKAIGLIVSFERNPNAVAKWTYLSTNLEFAERFARGASRIVSRQKNELRNVSNIGAQLSVDATSTETSRRFLYLMLLGLGHAAAL